MSQPIFGTDLTKPTSELIEGLRKQMARIRGQLYDIGNAHEGVRDRLQCVEGLLTCGLIALHGPLEECKAWEKIAAEKSAAPQEKA